MNSPQKPSYHERYDENLRCYSCCKATTIDFNSEVGNLVIYDL